jgi:hypothetical protein
MKQKPPRKKLHWSLKVFFGLAALAITERLCYQATAGFQVSRIQTPNTVTAFEETIVNPSMTIEVRKLLQQPFHFLGSGSQSYAFVSDDGQYVLKVFKQHHFYIPSFLADLPLPSFVSSPAQKLVRLQTVKREQFMRSCVIASESWKEETATLYTHLAPSDDLDFSLTLIDKLNISHAVQANTLQFAVQKKAELVSPTLKKLLHDGKKEAAEECIRSLIALIKVRSQKGVGDRDPVVRRNFGFLGHQAIEIDIGSYYENPYLRKDPLYSRAVFFEIKNLHGWLMHHFPELAPLAEKELEPFLGNAKL